MMSTGVYIHIPFCVKKCNYCDFASFVRKDFESYFDCLEKEIKMYSDYLKPRKVDTIFIGGGTPSFVNHKYIGRILKQFDFNSSCEVTIEVNPKTVDNEKIKAYKEYGINRMSIGLQSACDNELKVLGRAHNYDDFLHTFDIVRKNGFDNINVDVMFGIPEQTLESYSYTLNEINRISPEHVSAYSLIIEEGTPFYSMKLNLPDEETEREMFNMTSEKLSNHKRYEISNYAKPGFECRHNLKYWKMQNFIGFGVNAYSYVDTVRFSNIDTLDDYIKSVNSGNKPVSEEIPEDNGELFKDAVITGLRLCEGIDTEEIAASYGVNLFREKEAKIREYISMGYMTFNGKRLAFTQKGFSISNYILSELI
ncbi:MAG: radical SAM family heme chaperone HemW [Ruminococcaceae bacterium]|nr:radical SAM family heme chaperone HemW [Oscillospiraceae bacterium]